MKTIKQLLTTIAVLLCSVMANAHDFEVDGIYYNITSTEKLTVEVTFAGDYSNYIDEYKGNITIPSTIIYENNVYYVIGIGKYAFEFSSIQTITIPNNITYLKMGAFESCRSLTSIEIPNSVIFIEHGAFRNCNNLISITLSNNVTNIEYETFKGCSSLTSITIPNNVTNIEESAFEGCSSLTSITIPNNVTNIGESAFSRCSSLCSFIIPKGVNSIESGTFYQCSSLKSITLHENVNSIKGNYTFYNCTNLHKIINYSNLSLSVGSSEYGSIAFYAKSVVNMKELINIDNFQFLTSDGIHYLVNYTGQDSSIILPNNYNGENYTIGKCAFFDCSAISSISIPNKVTAIESYAFDNCTSLKNIIFEDGENTLTLGYNHYDSYYGGQGLFFDCPLESIYIGRNLTYPDSEDNYSDNSYGYSPFYAKEKLTSVFFGKCDSIISIKNCMFSGCYNLTNITIPNSIINIGHKAFNNCYKLKNITIPNSVTNIDSYAFYGCSNFTNITIPNSVTNIGEYAFNGCSKLQLVIIGTGVLSIGYKQTCPTKVIWLPNTPPNGCSNFSGSINYVSNDQYYFSVGPNSYPKYVYPHLSSMFEANGIKYVPVSPAERTCDIIDCTIDSPTTQINITPNIMYNGIEMIVNEIMPYAFYNNDYIQGTINIENKGNIGVSSFYECDNIENIIISNLGNIEVSAFANCSNLQIATISNQGYINSHAFTNCSNLQTVNISNQGNIESEAFAECTSLEQIDISNKGYIGTCAFKGCSNLKKANINNIYTKYIEKTDLNLKSLSTTYRENSKSCSFEAEEGAILSFNWSINGFNSSSGASIKVYLDENIIISEHTYKYINDTYSDSITSGYHTLKIVSSSIDYTQTTSASINNIKIHHYDTNLGGVNNEAFMGCSALTTVILGDSIIALGDKAFYQCDNLKEIIVPNSIKSIGKYCFGECTALENITLGNNLSKIREYTFHNCTTLKNIKIKDNITTIDSCAFFGCSSLINIEMGNNLNHIKNNAFENCSSLSSINIPNTITSIDNNVFKGCTSLKNIIIENRTTLLTLGSNEKSPLFIDCPLDSVYIGGKITYKYSPFSNTPLRTVIISDQEEQILDEEFKGCYNLQNVVTGDNVKSIGNYAFSGCCNLKNFTVGSNTEKIGIGAFYNCTAMTQLISNAIVPPTCNANALDDINKWSCVLKIPQNTLSAYKVAEQWKDFFFIEDVIKVKKFLLTYIVDGEIIHSDSVTAGSIITILDNPIKEGHTFSGWRLEDGRSVPKTMPAKNLTITGTFTTNSYWITYYVDDKFYCETERTTYGKDISLVEEPEKEGYTFSGWKIEGFDEIPETMPAQNLKIIGYFTINNYAVNYVIDGEKYATDSVVYGEEIILRDEPIKEGYTFNGWSEAPQTMPANDVTITGSFSINTYAITYMIDDEVFAIDSLTYGSKIVLRDEPEKEGYVFSGWSEAPETMPANDITITGSFDATAIQNVTIDATNIEIKDNSIILQNINNSTITIYTINGVLVKSIDNYTGEEIALDKGLYIVCIGNESIKIKI